MVDGQWITLREFAFYTVLCGFLHSGGRESRNMGKKSGSRKKTRQVKGGVKNPAGTEIDHPVNFEK